ncbi:MAG: modification methylase [Nitrososphaerota archaeon]|jgi:DNA modification methylase|nr:modification methylase [Nitrososphaerota archaeon]MDG6929774.1 modification methylase [Nitrososphaerota archaeon]
MNDEIIQVSEIPSNVSFNATLELITNDVVYFTHGFFKYPCKFIPQIPRWAILKYTKENDLVLDPFAGSGTTLVEAVLHQRNALGVDFDKLSQLLCITKASSLSKNQIKNLEKIKETIFSNGPSNAKFRPDLHNLNHWFPKENIVELAELKERINHIYATTKDKKIYNFLRVCFASTVKKCSYADDTSPKPYVSKRFKKTPPQAREVFAKTLEMYLTNIKKYEGRRMGKVFVISEDARNINTHKYDGKVALAITSPPYINAFDYVRSLRLENAWLGFYGDTTIMNIKRKQVGTEIISSKVYKNELPKTNNEKLDLILSQIYKKDKRRAFVVLKFFEDMRQNLAEVRRLLKNNSHYVIVVGDSKIRSIDVPTHELVIDIAKEQKFKLENVFSYIIKNRYLRIPRAGRGGLIKKDWIIDLVKENG